MKTLSPKDRARGWVPMACGHHAFVFRAAVLAQLSADAAEACRCDGGHTWAVKIEAVQRAKEPTP